MPKTNHSNQSNNDVGAVLSLLSDSLTEEKVRIRDKTRRWLQESTVHSPLIMVVQ
jgi:hypothetical protein